MKNKKSKTTSRSKTKLIYIGLIAIITVIFLIGAIPTNKEKTVKRIKENLNCSITSIEKVIQKVIIDFDNKDKSININIKVNPNEQENKDLLDYEATDISKYTLKALNKIVSEEAGAKLKEANNSYFGGLYDYYKATIKVYRQDNYIYSYSMIENNKLRQLK